MSEVDIWRYPSDTRAFTETQAMQSDVEIEVLERDSSKWSALHRVLVVCVILAALFSLPISIASRSPISTIVPFLLLGLGIGGDYMARNWRRAVRQRIEAHYNRRYIDTRWATPAAAEGVVVEVRHSGRYLKLAFPSGVTETYLRESLTPIHPPA